MSVGCLTDFLPSFFEGCGGGEEQGSRGGVSGRVKGHHCAEPDVTLQSQTSLCRARTEMGDDIEYRDIALCSKVILQCSDVEA